MIRARPLRWLSLLAAVVVSSCTGESITTVEVSRIEVSPSAVSLIPGATTRLEVQVTDEAGRALLRDVSWQSNDLQVVTVSSQGLVTAVGVGSTAVIASSEGVTGSATVTVGQGPVMQLEPDSVTLGGVSGSPDAETAVVEVSNSGGGVLGGLSASISYGPEGAGWLTTALNPTTAPADLGLSARAADLVAGTYTAQVAVSSSSAANSPQTVHVRFTVVEGDPRIRVSPSVVGFSATEANPAPAPQTLLVTNQGGGQIRNLTTRIRYVVGTSGWLRANLSSGAAPTNLGLSVDVQGLPVATYEARVDVSSPDAVNSPVTLVVTLRVGEPPPSLGLSAESLTFVAFHEGPPPAPQTVQITNQSSGTLSGIVTNVSYSGSVTGWLNQSVAGTTAPTTLTVAPHTTDLAPGTYAATVSIASPQAANSPRSLPVSYQVRPRADLIITQQGTPDPVAAGGKLTYRIAVRNAGPSTATSVVVNEDTPAGLTLDSAVPTRGSYNPTLERWTVGNLLEGASDTLTLVFTVPPGAQAPIQNSVNVTSAVADPDTANNASTVVLAVAPPVAPSNLAATTVTPSRIDLSWADNSTNETGFEIQRSTNAGSTWAQLIVVGPNVRTYSNTGLEDGRTYHYRVRAVNPFTQSAFSTPALATTLLAAPTALVATPVSASRIDLSWTDASTGNDEYWVERSTDGGTTWSKAGPLAGSVTSYQSTGLTGGTTYTYRVRACEAGETLCSAYSNEDIGTPPTLADLIVTKQGTPDPVAAGGKLTYRIVVRNAGPSTATSVVVNEETPAGLTLDSAVPTRGSYNATLERWTVGTILDGASDTLSLVFTVSSGAQAPIQNSVSVTSAVVDPDTVNNASAAVVAVAAPVAPSNLAATTVSPSRIDLSWADNSTNETGFEIQRSTDAVSTWTQLIVLGANVGSYSNTPLEDGRTYHYRVRAVNPFTQSAFSTPAPATTPLAAPTGLVATAVSTSQIDLSWTDVSTGNDEYWVERSPDGGTTWSKSGPLAGSATSYQSTGLPEGTTHAYRVRACEVGETLCSAFSNTDTEAMPLPAPSGLTAVAVSSNQIDLAWTDNSSNETVFSIERSDDGGGGWFERVRLGANTTAYSDTLVEHNSTYYYRIRAENPDTGRPSAYSERAFATTPSAGPEAAPSGLTATAVSATEIELVWTDNSTNETGFVIERSLNGGANWAPLTTVGANVTTYRDTGLAEGSRYWYRMRAVNEAGSSEYSTVASAIAESFPTAPDELIARAVSASRIDLEWRNRHSFFLSGFEIERSLDGGASWAALTTVGGTMTAHPDTGLAEGTTYHYRVRAVNSRGPSEFSNVASASTP